MSATNIPFYKVPRLESRYNFAKDSLLYLDFAMEASYVG